MGGIVWMIHWTQYTGCGTCQELDVFYGSRGPDTVLRMPEISSTAPEQNHLHIMSLALVTTEQQIQTCLFVHKFIVVSEEGSKLCWSMGEDFEDIGQKASL